MSVRPKIVVLDGHALNPGDLSWEPLAELGELQVHDRTPPGTRIERAIGASVLLTNKTEVDRALFAALPDLEYVGVLATGYDVVDVVAAADHGVTVTNVPAYSTASVAQMTFALLLELTNHTAHHGRVAADGRWTRSGDFSMADRPMVELDGLILGIVGLGRIGCAVARIGAAFGMRLIAASPSGRMAGLPVTMVDLDELFRSADVVSLHCPLTDATRAMVDATRLASMRSGSYLINTSRGGLVDESALIEALRTGRLAGAGLDVLALEPPPADLPLLATPGLLITPHVAWATRASRERLMDAAVDNLRAFLAGKPRNVVG